MRLLNCAVGAMLSCVAGCVNAPYIGTDDVARVVEKDASNLNRAHARATNSLILQNILRARDRWPTHYTTLGGIKLTPDTTVAANANFTPFGLGNAKGPFTGSGGGISQTTKAGASYDINPFSTNERSESLLAPLPKSLLAFYWNQGWPKDTLYLLFVGSHEFEDDRREFTGGADDTDRVEKFLKDARDKKLFEPGVYMERAHHEGNCPTIHSGPAGGLVQDKKILDENEQTLFAQIKALSEASAAAVHVDFEEGNFLLRGCPSANDGEDWIFKDKNGAPILTEYSLRSFDSMVYFVGESMRDKKSKPVSGPDCGDAEGENGPLFKVWTRAEAKAAGVRKFASSVKHAGAKYFALPLFDYKSGQPTTCFPERSAMVMSILTQLFLLNQSSEFLKAPDDILIQR